MLSYNQLRLLFKSQWSTDMFKFAVLMTVVLSNIYPAYSSEPKKKYVLIEGTHKWRQFSSSVAIFESMDECMSIGNELKEVMRKIGEKNDSGIIGCIEMINGKVTKRKAIYHEIRRN